MDVAQGVHDALTFDSSQRPGEEREVEAAPRGVDLSRADGSEGDAIREAGWQSRAGSGDLVGIGIDCENACGRVRVTKGQPAVTAPKLEHTEAVQCRKAGKRVCLGTLGVDPLGHARIMANPPVVLGDARPATRPRRDGSVRGEGVGRWSSGIPVMHGRRSLESPMDSTATRWGDRWSDRRSRRSFADLEGHELTGELVLCSSNPRSGLKSHPFGRRTRRVRQEQFPPLSFLSRKTSRLPSGDHAGICGSPRHGPNQTSVRRCRPFGSVTTSSSL